MFGIGKILISKAGPAPIIGPGALTVFAETSIVSTASDAIEPHGENQHLTSVVNPATCSKTVFAGGLPVTMNTMSLGTCGDKVTLGALTVKVS